MAKCPMRFSAPRNHVPLSLREVPLSFVAAGRARRSGMAQAFAVEVMPREPSARKASSRSMAKPKGRRTDFSPTRQRPSRRRHGARRAVLPRRAGVAGYLIWCLSWNVVTRPAGAAISMRFCMAARLPTYSERPPSRQVPSSRRSASPTFGRR